IAPERAAERDPAAGAGAADAILRRIAAARAAGVAGRVPVVARSRAGVSGADAQRIAAEGGNLLLPLQFMDWYFRGDQSGEAEAPAVSAALRALVRETRLEARAPQPFRRLSGLESPPPGTPADGPDLFAHLAAEMSGPPQAPRLRIIAGAAGIGKSVLIGGLLGALQDGFNAAKSRADGAAARPLFFDRRAFGADEPKSVDDLIERLFASQLAAHAPPAAFQWLHDQGFATWIFDGLDEFFRGQNDMFAVLGAKLDAPRGRAQTLIATRDSLFASAPALIDFLRARLARDPASVEIYELAPWDGAAQRAYLGARFAHEGLSGPALEARIGAVAGAIEARPELGELTRLPFYCALFATAVASGDGAALKDEFSLLQHAIDKLIAREADKLSIDWDVFVSASERAEVQALAAASQARGLDGSGANAFAEAVRAYGQDNLEFLLGGAAHFYRFGAVEDAQDLGKVSLEEWREALSPGFIDAALDAETEKRVELALVQFALFSRGDGDGAIQFTHEILADYLAGKYAAALIASAPERPNVWKQALGRRRGIESTVFFRLLVRLLRDDRAAEAGARAALNDPLLAGRPREILATLLAAVG
ncbi:MAG: hypothetical protein AAFR16_06320, partial [Pseudomonadota bacterium]